MPSSFCGEIRLFGIRVALECDHPAVLQKALSGIGRWNNAAPCSSSEVVTIALVADDANASSDRFEVRGKRLETARNAIRIEADGERGFGTCWFPFSAIGKEALDDAIKTAILFLVAQAGRTPIHASSIIVGGRAVVLAGRTGSGKSTLAMAAHQLGLPVLSEDSVFVQTEPSFCVWGLGGAIHLLDDDAPRGFAGTRVRSGRLKRTFPITAHQARADEAMLCVLAPGERVMLTKLDPKEAVQALTEMPEPGYDFYGSRMERAIRAVADGGCWRLTLSKQSDAAIAALVHSFSRDRRQPAVKERG